jgi:hypothetical protein
MSKIEDGGLAFPSEYYAEQGMTLHDYFAAAALQGLVTTNGSDITSGKLAEWAYSLADAMIEARKGEA